MSEIRLQLDLARNIFNLKVDLHLPAQGISAVSYTHLRAHETG
jgi:hypothetical protein